MSPDSNQAKSPLYFNCNMCGECCSSWNIPIETEKALRLLEKPWVQARLAETNREITPMTAETYRIPLTDENVCVFLAEDRRCMVESREGLSLKPHECQRFPFATVRLPDGTDWHETSAACKSISEKLLLAFEPIQPKPSVEKSLESLKQENSGLSGLTEEHAEDLLEGLSGIEASLELVARFPERVPVGGFQYLSQAQYQVYQELLRAIFTASNIHPEAALVQTHYVLRQVASGKEVALIHLPESLAQSRFSLAMAGMLTLCFLRKPYRTLSWVSLIFGPTYPDPRIFGMPIPLAEQRMIPWNPQLNRHLNAFLFNLLQRKRIISLGASLTSHLAMAGVACLLVQWYSKTMAWMQGSSEISEKDLTTAIRLVERYYTGHQPRFLTLFTSGWRGALIEALLFKWRR